MLSTAKESPDYVERGFGKRAVFLSPVLPAWDRGVYFEPLTRILNGRGFAVTILDTLSLIPKLDVELPELAQTWLEYFQSLGRIELLGGAAMGGSIVQTVLKALPLDNMPDVLLLSSPTRCDARLKSQLQTLAETATAKGAPAALQLLSDLVRPSGSADSEFVAQTLTTDEERAIVHRLKRGFEILTGVNAVEAVTSFDGRLLHIYGQDSRLVRSEHIFVRAQSEQRKVGIPNCGMRPLAYGFKEVELEVSRFLGRNPGN